MINKSKVVIASALLALGECSEKQQTSGNNSPAIQTGGNLTINFSKGAVE